MPSYGDLLSSDERWDAVFYVWRLSTNGEILEQGQNLFESDCATCHGEDGSGELLGSADFTDLRQMDNLAPRDLYLTVTQGRGSMPAWQSVLAQDERWAVIDYLRTFSYDPHLDAEVVASQPTTAVEPTEETATCATDQTNPFAWGDTETVQSGEELYRAQCAACHGPDGTGGLPGTPDFTTEEVNTDLMSEPGRYYCSIAEGVGVMPAFGASLDDEELWQVVTFLESLAP
jgi:mono/diheme cytochrome c family protein